MKSSRKRAQSCGRRPQLVGHLREKLLVYRRQLYAEAGRNSYVTQVYQAMRMQAAIYMRMQAATHADASRNLCGCRPHSAARASKRQPCLSNSTRKYTNLFFFVF